jgi:GTPase
MTKPKGYNTVAHPKTLLISVHAPYNKTKNINSYYDEFLHLVSSNNIVYDDTMFIKLRSVDAGYFFTKGKLEEIQEFIEKEKFEEVILSEQLTAQQERNLTNLFHCRVFDRTQIILEIFEKSAHSAEGKMQVAIAMFHYRKSRLTGYGIHMSQQAGHIGGKGPGETEKEKMSRHIEHQINKLKKQLKGLEKNRDIQRKRRLDSKIPNICLIGYTNTGKSTLLNLLTKADVLAEDKLFATLDTTTRELYVEGKKKGVISDTVGFIQQLPHHLINAFKSTLGELKYADLLLHVVDISDSDWEQHIKIVHDILDELGVEKDTLYVFNKADRPQGDHASEDLRNKYQPNVVVSAKSKEGIFPLVNFLHAWEKA